MCETSVHMHTLLPPSISSLSSIIPGWGFLQLALARSKEADTYASVDENIQEKKTKRNKLLVH